MYGAYLNIGLEDVPVFEMSFPSEDAALKWAIHCQRDRRNMTGPDIIRCVAAIDRRKSWGGDRKSDDSEIKAPCGALKTSEDTARIVGTSRAKVERARTVIDHAPAPIREAVEAGDMSINKAYVQTQEARKEAATPLHSINFDPRHGRLDWHFAEFARVNQIGTHIEFECGNYKPAGGMGHGIHRLE